MAITLLRKDVEGVPSNLMFTTTVVELPEDKWKVVAEAVTVTDSLQPVGDPKRYEVDYSEEEFHTNLRKEAAERGHLITSHSTDPEWNPEGYSKNLEDA